MTKRCQSLDSLLQSTAITGLTNDSRFVKPGDLFIAVLGAQVDGRDYIAQAIRQGAAAVLYEPENAPTLPFNAIPLIPISDLKNQQSEIAARFYDFPSEKIPVIGVTGTNGKTSVTQFIAQALGHCAVMGTIGNGFLPNLKKSVNTTPDPIQLQKQLTEFVKSGATALTMEVSSHGLAQHRVQGVRFHTAVFTNLTQDHLDYHDTMEKYFLAKEKLFQHPQLKNAVINIDDVYGKRLAEKYCDQLSILTFSTQSPHANIYLEKYAVLKKGFRCTIKTPWGVGECDCPLLGKFNLENILAVVGVLGFLSIPFETILQRISQLQAIAGRMQLLQWLHKPNIVIDYAHTPDALQKLLDSVRAHCEGKLWCVFGCGGNRDRGKRAMMGDIASRLSDHIIITNDNPRHESPEKIADDIMSGVNNMRHVSVILDRAQAITYALQSTDKNDWVVIAGKGHETEQVIGDIALPYSDYEVVCGFQH